jgi:hypothetical protein
MLMKTLLEKLAFCTKIRFLQRCRDKAFMKQEKSSCSGIFVGSSEQALLKKKV